MAKMRRLISSLQEGRETARAEMKVKISDNSCKNFNIGQAEELRKVVLR